MQGQPQRRTWPSLCPPWLGCTDLPPHSCSSLAPPKCSIYLDMSSCHLAGNKGCPPKQGGKTRGERCREIPEDAGNAGSRECRQPGMLSASGWCWDSPERTEGSCQRSRTQLCLLHTLFILDLHGKPSACSPASPSPTEKSSK